MATATHAEALLTPDTYRVLTNVPYEWTDEPKLRVTLAALLNKRAHSTASRLSLLQQRQLIERRWTATSREIRRVRPEAS